MSYVTKTDISGFFNNMKTILVDKKPSTIKSEKQVDGLCRTIDDKIGSTRTNIVYLNTDCNLRCEYCYEKRSREGLEDQADCTEEQINLFVNEIANREKDSNSCIVVMGGEPLLRFDLLEYLIKRVMATPKPRGWAIPVTTNGLMFLSKKFIERYKILFDEIRLCNNLTHDIEISFDASGQYRRKFPDGTDSRPHVEKAIHNVIDVGFSLRLSYTVHKGNYKNIVKDIVYICETYPTINKLSLSWAYQELDDLLGPNQAKVLIEQIKPYAYYLYGKYKIPICSLVCPSCGKCDSSQSTGNAYLSPTEGILYAEKETHRSFSQF